MAPAACMSDGFGTGLPAEATAHPGGSVLVEQDAGSRCIGREHLVDHTEHDVHVIITEQGIADLRGLPPRPTCSPGRPG